MATIDGSYPTTSSSIPTSTPVPPGNDNNNLNQEAAETAKKVNNTVFRVGQCLIIGMALLAAANLGLLFYRIVIEKIPLTTLLLACTTVAIACGIIGTAFVENSEGWEGVFNIFGPRVPELREGDSFCFEDKSYYIASTRGDGACGLHALLGIKSANDTVYAYDDPRQVFIKELSTQLESDPVIAEKWKYYMVDFLKDYLADKNIPHLKNIFSPLERKIGVFENRLSELDKEKEKFQREQEKLFDSVAVIAQDFRELKESNPKPSGFYAKCRGAFDVLIQTLDESKRGELQSNLNKLIEVDKDRGNLFKQFIEDKEVLEAYKNGVADLGYYFSNQEIGFAAYLFQKYVVIFAQNPFGEIQEAIREGDSQNPPVEIFHQGIHFSRCEAQPSPVS